MSKFIFALLLLSSSAFADPWRDSDSYREATFQALNIIDWGQTRYIAQHPDRYYEAGLADQIGTDPTEAGVDAYMLKSSAVHFVVSYLLPHGWRDAWQYINIAVKLDATVHNARIGIKISF